MSPAKEQNLSGRRPTATVRQLHRPSRIIKPTAGKETVKHLHTTPFQARNEPLDGHGPGTVSFEIEDLVPALDTLPIHIFQALHMPPNFYPSSYLVVDGRAVGRLGGGRALLCLGV